MSATQAFSGPPSRTDWLLLAMMADKQVGGDLAGAADLCGAIGPGTSYLVQPEPFVPSATVAILDDLVLFSITGTTGALQWVANVLGSAQQASPPIPGAVGQWFGYTSQLLYYGTLAALRPLLPGRTLIYGGHSLGGAIAGICASLALSDGLPVSGVYTLGAPRPGDPAFCASIDALTYRLEDTNDPIVTIPPGLWAGMGSAFPIPGPGVLAVYQHPGTAQTLLQAGQLVPGSFPIALEAAALQLATLSAPDHLAPEYARRLRMQWGSPADLAAGANGYAHPEILLGVANASAIEWQETINAAKCMSLCGQSGA